MLPLLADGNVAAPVLSFLPLIIFILLIVGITRLFRKSGGMNASIRKQAPGFHVTRIVSANSEGSHLAIDEAGQRICIKTRSFWLRPKYYVVAYQDVIESEIIENGHSVTSVSQAGLFGGAAEGEMFFGRTGALIGAMGAKRITKTKVTSIELKILVDDLHQPVHMIRFLRGSFTKGGWFYRRAMKDAYEWHGLLSIAIRRGAAIKQQKMRPAVKGL